jgi:hypothetical protein
LLFLVSFRGSGTLGFGLPALQKVGGRYLGDVHGVTVLDELGRAVVIVDGDDFADFADPVAYQTWDSHSYVSCHGIALGGDVKSERAAKHTRPV